MTARSSARSCSCCTRASRGSSCPRSSGWSGRPADAAAGLAPCGRVTAAARGAAGRTARRRGAGLVQGSGRQLAREGDERRPKTSPSPVDRARPDSKHHVITEAHGIPMAVSLTGGNRNDITQLMPLIEAIPPVRGRRGRPWRRLDETPHQQPGTPASRSWRKAAKRTNAKPKTTLNRLKLKAQGCDLAFRPAGIRHHAGCAIAKL